MSSEDNKNINTTESLHTLEGDLLASMKSENYASNIVKIVTHEKENGGESNKKSTEKTTDSKSVFTRINFKFNPNSPITYVGISIFFIILIFFGSYYFIHTTIKNTIPLTQTPISTSTAQATQTATSTEPVKLKPLLQTDGIFNADMVIPVQVATYNKKLFIEKINEVKTNLVKNNIKDKIDISLILDVNLDSFLDKIQYSGPETLIRSFVSEKPYSFGLYHTQGNEFETFLLTKIDIFDLAFSGMLDWERSMPLDFDKIYTYTEAIASVSSSTVQVLSNNTNSTNIPKFVDKVIKNIDTRTYIDSKKGVRITYGIINKQFLLITSGENSFIDIMNKLLVRNVLR